MQQFVVPQFIDVEDKIIGPITTRQFIIMLAGFLIIGIFYKLFDFSLFLTLGLFTLALTGLFAFLRINGRPFHFFILNLFQTFKRPRLRIWLSNATEAEAAFSAADNRFSAVAKERPEKRYTTSRLAELSLIVDTKGAYKGEAEAPEKNITNLWPINSPEIK